MKIKLIIVATSMILFLTSINVMSARGWIPGVSSGDYFTYEMYGVFTSNAPNMLLAIPEFEKNTTIWVRINITEVSGSVIKQVYTLHNSDESETIFSFKTDVNPQNQGDFIISKKGVPVCATNLNPGDRIPTAELILNETLAHFFPSGYREKTHASWNISDDWGDIYFDRETGMLLALRRTHIFANSLTGHSVEKTDVIKMIDTNRWKIDN